VPCKSAIRHLRAPDFAINRHILRRQTHECPDRGDSAATETHVYLPSDDFVRNATIAGMPAYEALCKEAETDYEGYWGRLARS
jgi:hypothetical protein